MLQRQLWCRGEQVFKHDIEPGSHPAHQRIGQSAQQGWLATTQELVEYQHAATGFDDAGNFAEAGGRVRDDGQDEV